MNRIITNAAFAAVSLVFLPGALTAQAMNPTEYKAGKDKIAAEYKAAKAACDSLKDNSKDVCVAEAGGKQKVAKAELEADFKPSDKARYYVSVAKAEATYAVAKEKCDDRTGADKTACVKEAKAVEARAKADAKASVKPVAAAKPAKATTTATTSKSQTPGAYVDDSVITAKVKAAVLEEPTLKSAEINVETFKGVVQLSGFVISKASIDKAVQVASKVEGVKSVKNDMIVKGKQ